MRRKKIISNRENVYVCAGGETKEHLLEMVMCRYVYICIHQKLLFTNDKEKERKRKREMKRNDSDCYFVRLVDTREKRQISGNTFFLFLHILF